MKVLMVILIVSSIYLPAQKLADSVYAFEINLTASPMYSIFREERFPGDKNNTALGYGFTLRSMWHPGRMLSIGIMTGYLSLSVNNIPVSSGSTANAQLSAVPLQGVISMQRIGVEFGIGMGPYLMISSIKGTDFSVGRRLELGLTFFLSYTYEINNMFNMGPEIRVLYLSYRGIISLLPSLTLRINAMRY